METDLTRKKTALLSRFSPGVLELDGSGLLERFDGEYTGAFAKLGKRYRTDAKSIKAVRPDGKLGETLDEDLALLALVQDLDRDVAARRATLAESYAESVFGLPHDELADRFKHRYTAEFIARHAGYHTDLQGFQDCAREPVDEDQVRTDARLLAELQSSGSEIDQAAERDRVAFGAYYAGRDTDVGAIAATIATASVLALATATPT